MNKIVPWLKAHWPIPALTVVALAALPTAMYFAGKMQEEFHAAYQKTVSDAATSVSPTAAAIKYGLPAMDGSGTVLEKGAPANEQMIAFYKKTMEDIQAKVGVVSEKGLAFNKGDHKPLIEGFFPGTSPEVGREFIKQYIDFHHKILADMHAGEPAKSEDIVKHLNEYKDAYIAKIRAELGRDLTPDEQKKLADELTAMRIGAVRKRAGEIAVYADPSVFDGVPVSVPEKVPSAGEAWDKQERAWVHQDICRAIALANGSPGTNVASSVVKRILRLGVAASGWEAGQPIGMEPGDEKAPLNFGVSLTGCASGPGTKNKWYDVRTATLDVIVSSANLPKFLNALAATNFMTILDMDISKIEPLNDMRDGYDYGDENVVKVALKIETVWLREWRKPFMPADVQRAVGMMEGGDVSAGGTPPAGSAPGVNRPPPKPPGGRPGAGGTGRSDHGG